MPQPIEAQRDRFLISTDPKRLDLHTVIDMLSRAYWAQGRTPEIIARTMQNSLVFGIYDEERQVGLARVVTDYATFAWLCDVFIHEGYRGYGLGKWLMETVLALLIYRDYSVGFLLPAMHMDSTVNSDLRLWITPAAGWKNSVPLPEQEPRPAIHNGERIGKQHPPLQA